MPVRYLLWLPGAVQGDLGYSIQSHRPIAEEIAKRIPPTLALMSVAILIAVLVGIPLGILSALRPYSKADYGMTTVTLALSSVPTFVLGLGAIYIFAVWLDLLPSGGMQTLGKPELRPRFRKPPDAAGDGAWAWPARRRCCATRVRACSRHSTASTSWPPRRRD